MQPPLATTPARQRLRTGQGSCKAQMLPVELGAAFGALSGSTGVPALQLIPPRAPQAQPTTCWKKEAFRIFFGKKKLCFHRKL